MEEREGERVSHLRVLGGVLFGERLREPLAGIDLALRRAERSWSIARRVVIVGEHGVAMMTQTDGSSNAKAKRVLGWRPQYASWRDGFRAVLQQEAPRARAA